MTKISQIFSVVTLALLVIGGPAAGRLAAQWEVYEAFLVWSDSEIPLRDQQGVVLSGANPYREGGGETGALVQIIDTGPNQAIDPINPDGTPGGDDILLAETAIGHGMSRALDRPGSFDYNLDLAPESRIFVRVFNAPTLADSTYYGETTAFDPSGERYFKVNDYGLATTDQQLRDPSPTPTASPTPSPAPTVKPEATPLPPPDPTPEPSPTISATPTPEMQPTPRHLVVDWDDYSGDGTSDIAVYRPSTGEWNILGVTEGLVWGGGEGHIPVPGDYDGDGRADVGYFDRFTGKWYVLSLSQGVLLDGEKWGEWGDLPVPSDYTGDGTADLAVYRPSTNRWIIRNLTSARWGWPGDIPVPGDYDGDGTTDIAMLRPSTGHWFVRGVGTRRWYLEGDLPTPMDYTGDGTTELAVYRPSTGHWFIRKLDGSYTDTFRWGLPERGDLPVVGDFDGDGLADPTIFRPQNNTWWIYSSFGPNYSVTFSAQTTDDFVTGATAY